MAEIGKIEVPVQLVAEGEYAQNDGDPVAGEDAVAVLATAIKKEFSFLHADDESFIKASAGVLAKMPGWKLVQDNS